MLEARRRAVRIKSVPIGAKDVRRLTSRDLDEFYARLASAGGRSGKGMHSTTRHHFHSLIRAALNQAIRWRWLSPHGGRDERALRLAPYRCLARCPSVAGQAVPTEVPPKPLHQGEAPDQVLGASVA